MISILRLLEEDAKLTNAQIAAMVGLSEQEVTDIIEKYEKDGIIKGYRTCVDWQKVDSCHAYALIELKVTPRAETGFDEIAGHVAEFEEVESVYLSAGVFDLTVMVKGQTIQDIAMFVAKKLSAMDSVLSTATHFILHKYKDRGVILTDGKTDERNMVV